LIGNISTSNTEPALLFLGLKDDAGHELPYGYDDIGKSFLLPRERLFTRDNSGVIDLFSYSQRADVNDDYAAFMERRKQQKQLQRLQPGKYTVTGLARIQLTDRTVTEKQLELTFEVVH